MDHRNSMSNPSPTTSRRSTSGASSSISSSMSVPPRSTAPGYMNLMPLIQFDYGLWYVKGGMYNLARGLGRLLDDLGVTVSLNREVASINRSGPPRHRRDPRRRGNDHGRLRRLQHGGHPRLPEAALRTARLPPKAEKNSRRPVRGSSCISAPTDLRPARAHHNFFFSKNQHKHFDTVFKQGKLPEDPTIYLVARPAPTPRRPRRARQPQDPPPHPADRSGKTPSRTRITSP